MQSLLEAYDEFIQRLVAWMHEREDIRGALIVGSRGRTPSTVDNWSDLDLILLTTAPERYLLNKDWLAELGPYWLTFTERDDGDREFSVLFEGALEVDFVPVRVDSTGNIDVTSLDRDLAAAMSRGYTVLLDKAACAQGLKSLPTQQHRSAPPTEGEFLNVVNEFWYQCVWIAKKLRRNERWFAQSRLHSAVLSQCLLPMIEWRTKCQRGWDFDTWYAGHFLEQWAEPWVIQRLQAASSQCEPAGIVPALLAAMDLFRDLSGEAAQRLSYSLPTSATHKTERWIRECISDLCRPLERGTKSNKGTT